MSTRVQRQIARSNEDALAAFVSKKAEVDAMLTRLQALSHDHFGYAPEDVAWSHVGTLEHYAEVLKRIRTAPLTKASTQPDRGAGAQTPMTNLMPLVHHARRAVRNRHESNTFTTDEVIADLIEALSAAYLAAPNARISRAIKVELDLLETLI
jgi:hypothetical protein